MIKFIAIGGAALVALINKKTKGDLAYQEFNQIKDDYFKIKDLIVAKINGEWVLVGSLNPSTIVAKAIED